MKVDILYDGNEANKLKGILNYLYERRNRQNYFSIVSATESGVEAERSSAIVLIDPEYTQTAPQKQFVTTNVPKSNFTISISSYLIKLQSYTLKSRIDGFFQYARRMGL